MSFMKASLRLLKLAKKPSRDELWLSIKLCFLGVAIVGLIGFTVYMLASFIRASVQFLSLYWY
ncbi:MAG: protein translocase SEC61 complex subunit gamma [Candidatus Bathyarchaeota archaeon]|nr:protein translocase SEC61 complex subunit gamma [Candidatus Bathyarchaeota archaeon]